MTPVQRMIRAAPTPGVITSTPKRGEPGGGTRSNDSIDVPGTPQQTPVVGIFSNAVDAELDGTASAIFTIHHTSMPDFVRQDFSRCKISQGDYVIDKVRKRYWRGVLDGYTFALSL